MGASASNLTEDYFAKTADEDLTDIAREYKFTPVSTKDAVFLRWDTKQKTYNAGDFNPNLLGGLVKQEDVDKLIAELKVVTDFNPEFLPGCMGGSAYRARQRARLDGCNAVLDKAHQTYLKTKRVTARMSRLGAYVALEYDGTNGLSTFDFVAAPVA